MTATPCQYHIPYFTCPDEGHDPKVIGAFYTALVIRLRNLQFLCHNWYFFDQRKKNHICSFCVIRLWGKNMQFLWHFLILLWSEKGNISSLEFEAMYWQKQNRSLGGVSYNPLINCSLSLNGRTKFREWSLAVLLWTDCMDRSIILVWWQVRFSIKRAMTLCLFILPLAESSNQPWELKAWTRHPM